MPHAHYFHSNIVSVILKCFGITNESVRTKRQVNIKSKCLPVVFDLLSISPAILGEPIISAVAPTIFINLDEENQFDILESK